MPSDVGAAETTVSEDDIGRFEANRKRLMSLGYRMMGEVSEAEDIVQETWLRWASAERSAVENPDAFLTQIATRLCLDRLKSARARREVYVGPWLPEPLAEVASVHSPLLEPHAQHTNVELAEDLSFALLLALDRLTPPERAAFLLHDVFGSSFDEVAKALDRTAPACRQLASRARRAIQRERVPRPATDDHQRLLAGFIAATKSGDLAKLESLLANDAVAYSDGGGLVPAATKPVHGANSIARLLQGLYQQAATRGLAVEVAFKALNGEPGLLIYVNDELSHALMIDLKGELIFRLYIVRNPQKLSRLRPTGH